MNDLLLNERDEFMKCLYILFFLLMGVGCSACGINTLPMDFSEDEESDWHASMVQLPPQTEYTLEELAAQAADFRDYIVSAYKNIQELAAKDESYESGKELVKKIEEQYGDRIAEFADIDFSEMTEDELKQYLSEFTSLTTVIREAKDALTLG